MKAKLLIRYKIGYDPDKKQKSKLVEIEEDGAKLIYVILIVSSEKDLEFMINERFRLTKSSQWPMRTLVRRSFIYSARIVLFRSKQLERMSLPDFLHTQTPCVQTQRSIAR